MSVLLYIAHMAMEERRAWIMVVVTVIAYTWYVVTILGRAATVPITEVSYVGTLLWTVGGAIVASIVLNIVVSIFSPQDADKKDQRDREINRFGEAMGQSFVIVGAVAAMLMAMAEFRYFWIANVIYLCFVLSSVLASTAKVIAYRRGLPRW
jgi:hypothetical protein